MNYKSVFRFLIIVPILLIFVAVGLDLVTPFQNQLVHIMVASPELASAKHITPICLLP